MRALRRALCTCTRSPELIYLASHHGGKWGGGVALKSVIDIFPRSKQVLLVGARGEVRTACREKKNVCCVLRSLL